LKTKKKINYTIAAQHNLEFMSLFIARAPKARVSAPTAAGLWQLLEKYEEIAYQEETESFLSKMNLPMIIVTQLASRICFLNYTVLPQIYSIVAHLS
jgi:hypothetical protein